LSLPAQSALRLSVTDRCNLRCRYCMPSTGIRKKSREELLSWEELIRTLIFQPLGITTVGFGGSAAGNQIDQPWQHRFDDGVYVPVPAEELEPPYIGPCGLIQISLPDWAKFIIMHLKGEEGGSPLLKPETFKILHTPPFQTGHPDYALGWGISDYHGTTVLVHNGTNMDSHKNMVCSSMAWTAPERDFGFLIATTAGYENAATGEACGVVCEMRHIEPCLSGYCIVADI